MHRNNKIQKKTKFTKKYFDTIYAHGETIDGDFNSKDHAQYLKRIFQLVGFHVYSIHDYGFGKGNLLKDVSKSLESVRVSGCDVSDFALKKLSRKKFSQQWSLKVSDIKSLKIPKKPYDLGICNSVLQYVPKKDLDMSLQVIAKSCRFAYLLVPCSEDYKIFKKELQFEDPYAFHRNRIEYHKYIKKYFVFVSYGILESKFFTKHNTSCFEDAVYRF